MSEAKTYTGGCHCGAVRYTVTLALERVIECNCSFCSKSGALLAFAPAEQFTLEGDASTLADYQFGKERIHHLFCTKCGVRSFSRGTSPSGAEMVSINARCLDGVALEALERTPFDGASL